MSNLRYPQIAARIFNTPLLIMQSKLITILEVLGPRMGFEVQGSNGLPKPQAVDDDGPQHDPGPQFSHLDGMLGMDIQFEHQDEGHYTGGGLAIIPIHGTLVQRGDWMSSWSGMLSYDRIEHMVSASIEDKHVREIVLDIDSPGGEVAGVFDLADRLYTMRGEKKITAVASELAASAAYLIATTADQIVVPRTGAVGSVGVVGAHYDYSRMMDKRGIAVTFIYAGDKKIDGNPYAPLPANVKAEWQEEINETYKLFVDTVARNMAIPAKKVRDTQAGVFIGRKAVDAGMAHRVNSFSNEVGNAVTRQGGSYRLSQTEKETQMSDKSKAEAEAKEKAEAQAKLEAEAKVKAEAEAKEKAEAEAKAKAEAEAKQKTEADPKKRIKAILDLEEAKGREDQANYIAFETDMSVDAAKGMLAKAPKAGKGTGLTEAMRKAGTPGVGAAADNNGNGGEEPTLNSAEIYSKRANVFGKYAAGALRPEADK